MPAIPLRISAASGNDRAQQGHPEAAGISRQGSDQGRDLLGSGEIVPRPQWRVKVTPKVFASELGLTNCRVIVFGLATSKGIYVGILIQGEMAELWGKNSRAEEAPASAGIFAFRKSITSRGRMEKLRNFCTRRESAQRCAFAARVKAGGKHDEESGPADVRSPVWSEAPKIPNRVWLPLLEVPPSGEGIRFVTWYDGMGSRIGFGLE